MNWLRDLFGINRYTLVWDFKHCGTRLKGKHDGRMLGGMSRRFARRMADQMNRAYGTDGHWIESVE